MLFGLAVVVITALVVSTLVALAIDVIHETLILAREKRERVTTGR